MHLTRKADRPPDGPPARNAVGRISILDDDRAVRTMRTVPPARTKAAREHRVPLAGRALADLEETKAGRIGDYVFPGQRRSRPLSGMAFEMLLRRINSPYTAHGFRSSFRDWAGNETHFPRELAEHPLAHVIGDKAEQAYALARGRELRDAWSKHSEGEAGGTVLPFKQPA